MTGALPPALLRPLSRPWPLAARALGGGVLGWTVDLVTDAPGPSWRPLLAAAVLAVVAAGSPWTARITAWGGAPALAAAAAAGLYVGVPETDHIVGLAVGLAVFALAELLGASRTTAAVVVALGGALVWADLAGSGTRQPALIAGVGALGLLLVAPLVAWAPGPSRPLVPRPLRGDAVLAVHAVAVIAIGRRGARTDSVTEVVALAAAVLAGLVVATRLVHGPVGRGAR